MSKNARKPPCVFCSARRRSCTPDRCGFYDVFPPSSTKDKVEAYRDIATRYLVYQVNFELQARSSLEEKQKYLDILYFEISKERTAPGGSKAAIDKLRHEKERLQNDLKHWDGEVQRLHSQLAEREATIQRLQRLNKVPGPEKAEVEAERRDQLMKEIALEVQGELEDVFARLHLEIDTKTAREKDMPLIDSGSLETSESLADMDAEVVVAKEEALSCSEPCVSCSWRNVSCSPRWCAFRDVLSPPVTKEKLNDYHTIITRYQFYHVQDRLMEKSSLKEKQEYIDMLQYEIMTDRSEPGGTKAVYDKLEHDVKLLKDDLQVKDDEIKNLCAQLAEKERTLMSIVHDLCAVLGNDFHSTITDVHPSLNDAPGLQPENISNDTLASLVNAVMEVKEQRSRKFQQLAARLTELCNSLDTSKEERSSFDHVTYNIPASVDEVTVPGALALDLIEKAEVEVERLDQLRASRMKEMALKRQGELEGIFARAHIEIETKTSREKIIALIDSGSLETSELLADLDAQIIKAKEEALSRKDILDKVEKWMSACEEGSCLEDYNKDDNRYSGSRGAHLNLKRAEKARVLVSKIPGLVDTLVAETQTWEEEHGLTFAYDGVPLLTMLNEYAVLRHAGEEDKKRARRVGCSMSENARNPPCVACFERQISCTPKWCGFYDVFPPSSTKDKVEAYRDIATRYQVYQVEFALLARRSSLEEKQKYLDILYFEISKEQTVPGGSKAAIDKLRHEKERLQNDLKHWDGEVQRLHSQLAEREATIQRLQRLNKVPGPEKAEVEAERRDQLMKEIALEVQGELEDVFARLHLEIDTKTAREKDMPLIDSGSLETSESLADMDAEVVEAKEEAPSRSEPCAACFRRNGSCSSLWCGFRDVFPPPVTKEKLDDYRIITNRYQVYHVEDRLMTKSSLKEKLEYLDMLRYEITTDSTEPGGTKAVYDKLEHDVKLLKDDLQVKDDEIKNLCDQLAKKETTIFQELSDYLV